MNPNIQTITSWLSPYKNTEVYWFFAPTTDQLCLASPMVAAFIEIHKP